MGKFISVFLAYLLFCNGAHIFRPPAENASEPSGALYIFMTAQCLLLFDLSLYPKHLRKLNGCSQTIVEFFIASFIMENVLLDFWIPLESGTKAAVHGMANKFDEQSNEAYSSISDYLRNSTTDTALSYNLSIFFLFAVLHAIRAVDFRALEEGPGVFFGDISCRLKRFLCKKLKSMRSGKRKVKIMECVCTNQTNSANEDEIEENNSISEIRSLDDLDNMDCDSITFVDYSLPKVPGGSDL